MPKPKLKEFPREKFDEFIQEESRKLASEIIKNGFDCIEVRLRYVASQMVETTIVHGND